jgi:serine/threonine-protein kinase RsbW
MRFSISVPAQTEAVIEQVAHRMVRQQFSPRDVQAVRLAMEEAIRNAITHGNGDDPAKHVTVRSAFAPEQVVVEVSDEGQGFDPASIPDPRAPENLTRASGRGVFLMRHFMTWVKYNAVGNCVTFAKRRDDDGR